MFSTFVNSDQFYKIASATECLRKMTIQTLLDRDHWRCHSNSCINAHDDFEVSPDLLWNWTR